MIGREDKRTNNTTMLPTLKNNAAAGFQGPTVLFYRIILFFFHSLENKSASFIVAVFFGRPVPFATSYMVGRIEERSSQLLRNLSSCEKKA